MTLTFATPRPTLVNLRRIWADAPGFATLAVLLLLVLPLLYAAMALDSRIFQGESPWLKPVKFHIALPVYLITLAFFARYLPPATRTSSTWRVYSAAVILAVLGETLWLSAAATQNTASHFNTEIPVFIVLYAVMGVLAVLLTSASLTMGIAIWRNKTTGLPTGLHLSVAIGLILTFTATVIVAGTLSASGGHFIGTSTRAMAIMGWSRDAGDLRVAHFFATHALHAVPLAGLIATRTLPATLATRAVLLATAAYLSLIAATFVQALNGQPFLPALG